MPGYTGNLRTSTLGDILTWCSQQPLSDVRNMLKQLSDETGLPIAAILALESPQTVANGTDLLGVQHQLVTDAQGNLIVNADGRDEAGGMHVMLTDRTGILASAPPVSKLWFQAASYTNPGIPSITQPAPGGGLRNVVLAWGFGVACGVNAQPPILISFSAGPQMYVACPANDWRGYSAPGPLLGGANSSLTMSCSVTPPVGANLALWMVGYVAAFP